MLLSEAGFRAAPFLCISDFLLQNTEAYFSQLSSTKRNGDYLSWVKFMLGGFTSAAKKRIALIEQYEALIVKDSGKVRKFAFSENTLLVYDYISLTDIARYRSEDPSATIQNWMRNRDVIEFLGLWETIHNPDFKPLEFEGFKQKSGYNAFTLSPKRWADTTAAIGIYSKAGRYGGTYAHRDIAFEFASWISAEFKLYIITDYQRLKNDENSRLSLNWNMNQEIAKINYHIHTDAFKEHLVVQELRNNIRISHMQRRQTC